MCGSRSEAGQLLKQHVEYPWQLEHPQRGNTLWKLFTKTPSKDYAIGTALGTHTPSFLRRLGHMQRGWALWSSMGTLSMREGFSQHERAGCLSIDICREMGAKIFIKSRPVGPRRSRITG